ncbi:MAG: hypothetical protein ABIH23_31885 [bacterium]
MGLGYDATGNLFVAEYGRHVIRKVTPSLNPQVFRVVGSGSQGYVSGVTNSLLAVLNTPSGVVLDSTGYILFSDQLNQRVRRAIPGGSIFPLIGNGTATYAGDGSAGTLASLNRPAGLSLNSTGELLIADQYNNRIRLLSTTGTIRTRAGNGTAAFSGDGILAVSASLNQPQHAVMDASGNIYVADTMNHRVRKISANGMISTIAGTGVSGYSGDGGQAIHAQLTRPFGLLIDGNGDLLIVDRGNSRIRRINLRELEPALVNPPRRTPANLPGSVTLTVLDSGNGTVVPGRVRRGATIRADMTLLDRSFSTASLIASVSWQKFVAQYVQNSLLTNGTITAATATSGKGILFNAVSDTRSLVDVSFSFVVGNANSTAFSAGSPIGTVIVVDATDPGVNNRSISTQHPGNLAWTGSADAGVVSTTIEIDNTSPEIKTFQVSVSNDGGATFHPVSFPSVNGSDILLITATVQSDSLASLSHNILSQFNSDSTRFDYVYSSTSLLQAGAAGNSLFAATVFARAVQNPLPITPKKVTVKLFDILGNETQRDAINIGVKTLGPSLITSDLIVNGKIAPEGAYRAGPDNNVNSVAEISPGDEIQLVASFGSFNTTGLEVVTADFTPLYPPELSPYVNALVPSATSRSGYVLTATWTYSSVNLGAGGISNVTFAHPNTIGKTALTLSTAGLPPGVTPTALPGVPGTPRITVQTGAVPQSATTIRMIIHDTDSAFPATSIDTQILTVDSQRPEAQVLLSAIPPFRPASHALAGVPQRVKGGDRLTFSVQFTNPRIIRNGNDFYAAGTSASSITADLSAIAGPLASAVTPAVFQSVPHPGLPTTHVAEFNVTVSDQFGTTETTSMQQVNPAFYVYDDVGNALEVIEPATPIAVDNHPPLVNITTVQVLLESGQATNPSGGSILPGQTVPTGSALFPQTALKITGTNIWDPIDSALDILTATAAIRTFFTDRVGGNFIVSDAASSSQNVFPTFVLTMPTAGELRTTEGFSIIVAVSDTLGNCTEKRLVPTFSVNGDPALVLNVLNADGQVVAANAAGRTVKILSNRQTTISASGHDIDAIANISFQINPADRFTTDTVFGPFGSVDAVGELHIVPHTGTYLGPAEVTVSITDAAGGLTVEKITLLIDQPPSFAAITAGIYQGGTLVQQPDPFEDPLILNEDQRLVLSLSGSDPDPANTLTLSATGSVFYLPNLGTASLNGHSATEPVNLPVVAGPQQGGLSVAFEIAPTYRTVSPTVGQSTGTVILTLSDGNLSETVSLPISIVHKPTVPQISISGIRAGGVSLPIDPNVQIREGALLSIDLLAQDVSGELLTITRTLGATIGSFAATPSIDRAHGYFSFRPGSFDADLPEIGAPTLHNSPIDPSILGFTVVNESGGQVSISVLMDIVNEPAPPVLTTIGTLDGRAILPNSATVAVTIGQKLVVRAEAIDSDKDLIMIDFEAPAAATVQTIHRVFGSATSELSLTFDESFAVGENVQIKTVAWDQSRSSPTFTYAFKVVELSDRLSFLLPFYGILTGTSGARFVSAATEIVIRETDHLDLIVSGRQSDANETVTISAQGTGLSNSRLESAVFAGKSVALGDQLPFTMSGVGSLDTNYRLRPGLRSVPPDQATMELALDLVLSDEALSTEHTLKIIVENVTTTPTLVLKESRIDGIPVSITQTVSVREGSVLTIQMQADDPGAEAVSLTASGLPGGAEFLTASGIPPVTGTLVYRPGPSAAELAPYHVVLRAVSDIIAVAQVAFDISVVDRYHPPEFQLNLTIDEEPVALTDPIRLDTLEMLNLEVTGIDADASDVLVLSVSGTALAAQEMEHADFAGLSVKTGSTLPFTLQDFQPAGTLSLYPGVWANLPGNPPKEYTIELNVSDGVFDVTRALNLEVTADEAPPIVRLSAIYLDGVLQAVSDHLRVSEGHVLTGTVTAIDPAGLPLVLSAEESKRIAQTHSALGVWEVTSAFSVAPGPTDSSYSPLEIVFTAENERSEVSQLTLTVDLLDVNFPAQAALEVYVDGDLQPSSSGIYDATVGHQVSVVGYAWDPDREAVILGVSQTPVGSQVYPAHGLDIKLGAGPAIVSVTFVPQVIGETVSILFTAADSLTDFPLGDLSIPARVFIKSASIPPILTIEPSAPDPLDVGQSLSLIVFVDDPEGDAVTLYPFFDGEPVVEGQNGFLLLNGFYELGTLGAILVFVPGSQQVGEHLLTIEATDGQAISRKTVPITVRQPVGTPTPTPTPTPTAVPDLMVLSQGYGGNGTVKRLHRIDDVWRLVFFSAFQGLTRSTAEKLNTTRERSVNTAIADINGDGVKDIVVGFGPGGFGSTQPSILVVWRTFGGLFGRPTRITSKGVFSPIASNEKLRNPHGALNVATGNFVGPGLPMIAAAQGMGGSHQIRILQYQQGGGDQGILETVGTFRGLQQEALWGNSSGGTAIAAGDVDGDSLDELVIGQMNGDNATTLFQVLNLKKDTVTGEVQIADWTQPVEAFASHQQGLGGVNLTVGDVNSDRRNEIIVATAGKLESGAKNFVRAFQVETNPDGSIKAITPLTRSVQVLGEDRNPSGGIDIAAGNLDEDHADEVLVGTQANMHLNLVTGIVTFNFAPPKNKVEGLNFLFDPDGNFTGTSFARIPFSPYGGENVPSSEAINVEFYPAD